MAIKHKLLQENEFHSQLAVVRKSAKEMWAVVTTLAIDVILHYHQHSFSTGRIVRLYDELASAGLYSHQSALVALIQRTTGIASIGDGWKHDKAKFAKLERDWQEVLSEVEETGLHLFFEGTRPKSKDRGEGNGKKARATPVVKLPEELTENISNAMQITADMMAEATPEQQFQALAVAQRVLKGQDVGGPSRAEPSDPELRMLLRSFVTHLIQLESQTELVESKTSNELESGADKAKRMLQKSDEMLVRILVQDFNVKAEAVIKAAEAEAQAEAANDAKAA
jgi:hypothetical protein